MPNGLPIAALPARRLASKVPRDARDLPADVESVLSQLLAEAATAAEDGDVDTVVRVVDTVATVTTNKVPEGRLRERLLFGCQAVRRQIVGVDPDSPFASTRGAVAAEYLRRMADRVAA